MSLHKTLLGTLTIPSGSSNSPALSTLLTAGQMKVLAGSVTDLEITGPAALTGACTVQTVPVEGSTSWTTATLSGNSFAIPVDTTVSIPVAGWADLRIHSAGTEGGNRSFILVAQLATM